MLHLLYLNIYLLAQCNDRTCLVANLSQLRQKPPIQIRIRLFQ
nr:MAG TPA: hypothetical protein [Caudoviricetes sp.]